jgi:hypothetical protein
MKNFTINKLLYRIVLFSLMLLIISCFSPIDGDKEGNVTIVLPGHSAAKSAIPSSETQTALAYDIICANGAQSVTNNASVGETSLVVSLSPGTWDITAEAYLPGPPPVHVGTGQKQITVTAGKSQSESITLVFDNTGLDSVTINWNGTKRAGRATR